MENEKEIQAYIKDLKSNYEASLETPERILEEKMSFLDKLNNLVRLILNDNDTSVYDALNEETIKKWHEKRSSLFGRFKIFLKNNIQNTPYVLLLLTIIGFLVSEALSFYAIDGIITTKTYVKAILTELCFVFLSGYRSKNKYELICASFLRVCIFVLMVFVISTQVLIEGKTDIGNTNSVIEQIQIVEEQIRKKESDIEYYRDVKNWPNTARKIMVEKDKLVETLIDLKKQQSEGANKDVSVIVEVRMYARAAFRVILLLITILITRRILVF